MPKIITKASCGSHYSTSAGERVQKQAKMVSIPNTCEKAKVKWEKNWPRLQSGWYPKDKMPLNNNFGSKYLGLNCNETRRRYKRTLNFQFVLGFFVGLRERKWPFKTIDLRSDFLGMDFAKRPEVKHPHRFLDVRPDQLASSKTQKTDDFSLFQLFLTDFALKWFSSRVATVFQFFSSVRQEQR